MRGLSESFLSDLKLGGKLSPILERVRNDHTLMFAIRDRYVNVYYRGGNILRVAEQNGGYQTFFDVNFAKSGQSVSDPKCVIRNLADAQKLVACLAERKMVMDAYSARGSKTTEREFQQLVARENNNSSISNESEYFVTDIEVAIPRLARFDITAVRWLAKDRKTGNRCRAALIEMKYSDCSLEGNAGLLKHLKDMDELISNKEKYTSMLQTMECQFNQLDKLELLNYNKGTSNAKVKLNPDSKPEVIFIIANHNPRSPKLKKILSNPEISKYENSELFDLRFFVSSFAGYGLHAKNMHTLTEFKNMP